MFGAGATRAPSATMAAGGESAAECLRLLRPLLLPLLVLLLGAEGPLCARTRYCSGASNAEGSRVVDAENGGGGRAVLEVGGECCTGLLEGPGACMCAAALSLGAGLAATAEAPSNSAWSMRVSMSSSLWRSRRSRDTSARSNATSESRLDDAPEPEAEAEAGDTALPAPAPAPGDKVEDPELGFDCGEDVMTAAAPALPVLLLENTVGTEMLCATLARPPMRGGAPAAAAEGRGTLTAMGWPLWLLLLYSVDCCCCWMARRRDEPISGVPPGGVPLPPPAAALRKAALRFSRVKWRFSSMTKGEAEGWSSACSAISSMGPEAGDDDEDEAAAAAAAAAADAAASAVSLLDAKRGEGFAEPGLLVAAEEVDDGGGSIEGEGARAPTATEAGVKACPSAMEGMPPPAPGRAPTAPCCCCCCCCCCCWWWARKRFGPSAGDAWREELREDC